MKKNLLTLLVATAASSCALAETVYVTARPSPCTVTANCPGANTDGTYSEQFPGLGDYGAVGSAPGHPQTTVARTYIGSSEITDPTYGVTLTPRLGTPGGVYRIHYNFNSVAGNTSTNVVLSVACTSGGALSFTETDKFQRQYGNPANQWQFLGYLTNSPGSSTPTIEFRYKSGRVSGAGAGAEGNRLLFDCWRFTLEEPCLVVNPVQVVGPLAANVNEATVAGVTNATAVAVYQNTGSGWTKIGTKTTGVVNGNNVVTVAGLLKGAQVAATQTVNGQEGCVPASGTLVGGGANPSIRVVLTIRETTNETAVVGAAGNTTSANLHFLGTSNAIGGAPIEAPLYYPSNTWQTVSFSRDADSIATPASVSGATMNVTANGYIGTTPVKVQVYAYKTLQPENTKLYSRVPVTSGTVTSNDLFGVNWTWTPVAGAEGYRLLRSVWDGQFSEKVDVTGTSFADSNDYTVWTYDSEPMNTNAVQRGASVQWNGTPAKTNNIPGLWGTLESINFAIDNLTDTGPFDIYIDNIQNGTNVFQTFEAAPGGMVDYVFRAPSFSGTTAGNILAAPNVAAVTSRVSDTGGKALRVRFQWNGLVQSKWLRLTTSGAQPVSNPFVNLDQPISFRMLLVPVGGTLPPAPTPPTLSADLEGGKVVLDWEGAQRLQTAVGVDGPYTNVIQTLSPNTYLGPWTNSYSEPSRFFRLAE